MEDMNSPFEAADGHEEYCADSAGSRRFVPLLVTESRARPVRTMILSHRVVTEVSRELDRQFAGLLSATVITSCVASAIRDLRGSISGEALPEMAARLAGVRLAALVDERTARASS